MAVYKAPVIPAMPRQPRGPESIIIVCEEWIPGLQAAARAPK